jgi:hypothetical protein
MLVGGEPVTVTVAQATRNDIFACPSVDAVHGQRDRADDVGAGKDMTDLGATATA